MTSLDFLRNCKGLREVHLQACVALRDMDALAGLADLEVLDLSSTPVSDIGFLKDANKLRELDLSRSQVTDISALAGATALERLNLRDTRVTDLSPLLPMLRANGLPLIELPVGLSEGQRRSLTEATTLPPEEMKRIAPTGLTLVVCNADNEVLDTLVVKPDVGNAEYKLRIPKGLDEIRVFGVGSRMRKNPDQWDDVHETFAQFYTLARADDRISQEVTAHLKDGVLSGFGTSINAAHDSRPMRLTESLRNQIHADIAANQRTMPIFLVEKSDTSDGVGFGTTVFKPVE